MKEENVTTGEQLVQGENFEKVEDLRKHVTANIDPKGSKVHGIISNELQEHMKEIRQDVLELVNSRMNDILSELLQKVDRMALNESKDPADSEKYTNRTKPTKEDKLPNKQFLQRNSLLTDLYEIKHIRTIYNLLVSILIILLIYTAVYDIKHTGSSHLGMRTMRAGFGKFHVVLYVWTLMKASAFGVYAAFYCWATRRLEYSPKSFSKKLWDLGWLATAIVYYTLLLVFPPKAVLENNLPLPSSTIILMEQTRLVMKTYGFIRTMAPKFLSYKQHAETPAPKPPDFSKYLYFMFAPTLIYQDSYPRTKKIRWNVVLTNFAEVIAIMVFVALLYEKMLYARFKDFGKQPVEWEVLMFDIFSTMLPGTMLFVFGFYLLLHSWMNAFAELLRFADKMFYKDWWNSSCFSSYYRTWNIVVHDWLYTYIYKDLYEMLAPRNRTLAVCSVFTVSAIVHEYILCVAIRFFFPVMFMMLGVVGLTVFFFKSAGNVFVWFSLCVGNGVIVSFYCMEYFARINCQPGRDDFWDLVIPRSFTCAFK